MGKRQAHWERLKCLREETSPLLCFKRETFAGEGSIQKIKQKERSFQPGSFHA